MFTVIRFSTDADQSEALAKIATQLLARHSKVLPPRRGVFAVVADILDGGRWLDHADAIEKFVGEFRELITWAIGLGFRVNIDTAVYSEDAAVAPVVGLPMDAKWLSLLGELGITFEFSLSMLNHHLDS